MNRLLSLYLISNNIPLSEWEKHDSEDAQALRGGAWSTSGYSNKNVTRVIDDIVRQLSSDKVVQLIARDWDNYPATVRMGITEKVNTGHRSGNVTKNVQKLDKLLGGRVLSATRKDGVKVQERVETRDGVYRKDKHISGSKAGAMRKYQILN